MPRLPCCSSRTCLICQFANEERYNGACTYYQPKGSGKCQFFITVLSTSTTVSAECTGLGSLVEMARLDYGGGLKRESVLQRIEGKRILVYAVTGVDQLTQKAYSSVAMK